MQVNSTYLAYGVLIAVGIVLLGNSGGAPAGRSGAPGDSTCGTSSCHSGTLNSGGASIDLRLNDGSREYEPGASNTLTISINNAQDDSKNGFEILALDAAGNNFGSWELVNADETQLRAGSDSRSYVTHTRTGNSKNSWQVDWVAPENATDTVTFYLAVNDANNDGGRTGDQIYTTTLSVTPFLDASSIEFLDPALVKVYPNPFTNMVNIESSALNLESYALFNMLGQQVLQGQAQAQLDFAGVEPGAYTLKLETSEGLVIKRLQKL